MSRISYRRLFTSAEAGARGIAAVEFAMVAPVLLLILAGVVQLGMALATGAALADAAKVGAQYAALRPENAANTAAIQTIVRTALGSAASGATITPATFCECNYGQQLSCSATCGNGSAPLRYVRVTVTKPLESAFGRLIPYPTSLTQSVSLATSG